MIKVKKVKPTRAELEQKILELEALMAGNLHFASAELDKAGPSLVGSAVIVDLKFLGGKRVCQPFAIRDGFHPETIEAIREDIRRSYGIATMWKPAGYTEKEYSYLSQQGVEDV